MSQILHRASQGEDVVGKWGIILTCRTCTSIEEDDLEIRSPRYRGVRLPFTTKLDIKRSGLLPGSGETVAYRVIRLLVARLTIGHRL